MQVSRKERNHVANQKEFSGEEEEEEKEEEKASSENVRVRAWLFFFHSIN